MVAFHRPKSLQIVLTWVAALTVAVGTSFTADTALGDTFLQSNLASDVPGAAAFTDPFLVNPWGIAFGPTSPFWIASQGTDTATLYDGTGGPQALVVSTPPTPTGAVFNSSGTSFEVTSGGTTGAAVFLFATQAGQIAGWKNGTTAVTGFTATDGARYTGLTRATVNGADFLYAADFHNGKIDVIDSSFLKVTSPAFTDPNLPSGFAPYNIQLIGGKFYVTYAKIDTNGSAAPGAGAGFVDVFDLAGNFSRRLVSGGPLNAPWGLALAPSTFGQFAGDLLVGNHGDGTINAFDPTTGAFLGVLDDTTGNPVMIDGLWALEFGNSGPNFDPNALYFDAGLAGGTHGLFGELQDQPTNVAVPGPIVGAGLPGLLVAGGGLLGWWRRKRKAGVIAPL